MFKLKMQKRSTLPLSLFYIPFKNDKNEKKNKKEIYKTGNKTIS